MLGRFKLNKSFADPETGMTYPKGTVAENWGDAAKFRAANQVDKPAFPGDEVYEFPPGGDARPPFLKPDDIAARPAPSEPPSLSQRADAAMRDFLANNKPAQD